MGARILLTMLGITLLAGCAAQEIQTALPADHPANPEAAVASAPARSTTLRIEPMNAETASAPATRHDHAAMERDAGGSADDHAGHGSAAEMGDDVATAEADAGGDRSARAAGAKGAGNLSTLAGGRAAPMYVCPMHKNVTSDKPGKCPKCKMKLKAKKPGSAGGASSSPSAGDPAAPAQPAPAGSGDTAASEATEGDNAQGAHEGHDTDGGNK